MALVNEEPFVSPSCSSTESFSGAIEGDESFEEVLIENYSGDTEILLIPRPRRSETKIPVHVSKFLGQICD